MGHVANVKKQPASLRSDSGPHHRNQRPTSPEYAAFAAAAAIGGLGGLAQIGNNGSILDPSTEIRNGISGQFAVEGEQVLNHFLDRLPIITLKEGSRARVYIGTDLLVPSYAEHRVDPTL